MITDSTTPEAAVVSDEVASDEVGLSIHHARIVSPHFRPAADYLLAGPPALAAAGNLILVEDSDVGPILTHPDDEVVGQDIRLRKIWEPGESRYLRSVLRPGMNAIDVGANIGYFTRLMADAVGPEGQILGIEAEPETFQILRANTEGAGLTNVELLPVAAHARSGIITIVRDPVNHGGSTGAIWREDWASAAVQAVALDDVIDPECPIDFVKIDVEGMDHVAIKGLARTLRRWRPTVLTELNPVKTEALGSQPRAVLQMYRDLGMEVHLLREDLLRLHRWAEMPLDDLLLDNLVVMPQTDEALIAHARRINYINLVLVPKPMFGDHVQV